MLSVAEARERVLGPLTATSVEVVGLADAWGRVLAAPVAARLTQPPANVSAMDGYALRALDGVVGARLAVIGAAPAGQPFAGAVLPGQAVRLFTGSVVPDGADTILLQEDATRQGDMVTVNEACAPGRHIRLAGQDFAAGSLLLAPGRRLGARDIGLAAAGNHPWLTVHRRPRIAILATGDEIVMPGEPVGPGGIVSSNAHALAALVRAAGGEPVLLPIVRDDRAALAESIARLPGVDMLVTSGGASVGDHDLVQAALSDRGFQLDFWKVAMRPGKPLISGSVDGLPVLGLPGNPVSVVVCAVLFLLPALDVLCGLAPRINRSEPAVLGAALRANDGRADHLRSALHTAPSGVLTVTPFERQDSGMLTALARADALLLRAPHAPAAALGATVEVIRLGPLGV